MSNQQTTQSEIIEIQGGDHIPEAPESVSSGWTSLVPMILIFVVFYFLLIRPQEKRRKAQQDLVSGVKKGEKVLTNSGIIGVVTKIDDNDNTIFLEIAKGVEIKMIKTAITDITSREKKTEVQKIEKENKKGK